MLLAAIINLQLEQIAVEDSKASLILATNTWSNFLLLVATTRSSPPPVLPSIFLDTGLLTHGGRLRTALTLLVRFSLLTHETINNSYSIHTLTYTWLQQRRKIAITEQAVWCEAANTMLVQSILLPSLGLVNANEPFLRDLLPHLDHARTSQDDIKDAFDKNIANHRFFLPK